MGSENKDYEFSSFNPAMLHELSSGNSEFIKQMVSIFLEDVPKAIDEMKAAASSSDFATVGQLAHRIKSSVGMVGAEDLHALASNIEEFAENSEQIKAIPSMLEKLGLGLTHCCCELEQYSKSI
jgi:HPt (histidine-containing phosphotransfer) domain-containing protein